MKLSELAEAIPNASFVGTDCTFNGVNEAGSAEDGELEIWLSGPVDTESPAVVPEEVEIKRADDRVVVPELGKELPRLLAVLQPSNPEPGISSTAQVSEDFQSGASPHVGDHVSIGPDVSVGDRVRIEAGVTIRGNVRLADDVTLRSGVRIESPAKIGAGTTIHANSVIGADGFGYHEREGTHQKIPQIGKVVIGENVEIGSLVTVDRAMYGETVIGDGTKIDNMVHVGHNCKIGKNVILISLTGISGSVEIGDNVTIAAQSGIKEHVSIADGVTVAGRGGVTKDITEENSVVSGFPARDHREQLKQDVLSRKLPEFQKRLENVEEVLEQQQNKEN